MVNNVGETWPLVAALFALMRSEDALNSERSVGVAVFANCSLSRTDTERLSSFEGTYDSMLKLATNFYPIVGLLFESQFVGTTLEHNITTLKNTVMTYDFQATCMNLSSFDRTAQTNLWRNCIWNFMLLIDAIRINNVIGTVVLV